MSVPSTTLVDAMEGVTTGLLRQLDPGLRTPTDRSMHDALDVAAAPGPRGSVRVGIDVVMTADVDDSVRRLGDRYLHRIYTAHERHCCRVGYRASGAPHGYSIEGLAARFAAKEATLKVLRPVGVRPEWRSIEVYRTKEGGCELRLTGRAAAMAREAGIGQLVVSLTHEPTVGAAVVVGMCGPGDGRRSDDRIETEGNDHG
jgi:holo-[acyl-carrier protein] synthase